MRNEDLTMTAKVIFVAKDENGKKVSINDALLHLV